MENIILNIIADNRVDCDYDLRTIVGRCDDVVGGRVC